MTDASPTVSNLPRLSAVLELFKPITWFASMWAYACGVVSAGRPIFEAPGLIILGIVLCGPLVCATSQAVNDWFDRHVDAINEPMRPIPSGRIPGNWGLYIAIGWTIVSLGVGWLLGTWGFYATCVGLALAWAYSAPPFRLKRNGWYGNTAVAVCYEGLPWITGAAVMGAAMPDSKILAFAALYSVGAHGIMTLNDFKSIEGDLKMGIGSLPARLGVARAAKVACAFMALPQVAAIFLLLYWGHPFAAIAVIAALGIQFLLMFRLLDDPAARAPWYNATGTGLYVLGMMACAIAIGAGG